MNYDHILLLGYGAPRRPDEVLPFLKAMSRGRDVPQERLQSVARHYEAIGGASPYSDQVSGLAERLAKEIGRAGVEVPIFIGMKNWHPFLEDVLTEIHSKGHTKGLAIPLTAYRTAAAGAGYKENLEFIRSARKLAEPTYRFVEGWYHQRLFIEAQADETTRVLQSIDAAERAETPILFSFHSLPCAHDRGDSMCCYSEEARDASALVAGQLGHAKWSVVYQSRPVAAKGQWLCPDICEEIKRLGQSGEKRVVVVPLGFLCDNAEILYDLDHAAREVAEQSGMKYLRANTVHLHPKIGELLKDLLCNA